MGSASDALAAVVRKVLASEPADEIQQRPLRPGLSMGGVPVQYIDGANLRARRTDLARRTHAAGRAGA